MVRNICPDMGRLGAAGAGADVAGFGDVEDGGGVAAVDRARGGDCRVQISRTSGDLTSTGFLHGRTQGSRAPRARRILAGENGDGHLLVVGDELDGG